MAEWINWAEYSDGNVGSINYNLYGVYVLSILQGNLYKVFYVGSGNIKERLVAHRSQNESNRCISRKIAQFSCYFSYREVPGGDQVRKTEEQNLIASYQNKGEAECNRIDAQYL